MYKFVLFTCLDECCWVFSVLWYFDLFKILLTSLLLFMFCHMHVLNKNLMAEKKIIKKRQALVMRELLPNAHLHVTFSDVVILSCRKVNNGFEMLEFNFCVY